MALTERDIRNGSALGPYMDTQQQEFFRSLLAERRKLVMTPGDTPAEFVPSDLADMADRAAQKEEFSPEHRARDTWRTQVKAIDRALQRLDSGDYGFCEVCGEEIGLVRLLESPETELGAVLLEGRAELGDC